jgi:hypothetical protein
MYDRNAFRKIQAQEATYGSQVLPKLRTRGNGKHILQSSRHRCLHRRRRSLLKELGKTHSTTAPNLH